MHTEFNGHIVIDGQFVSTKIEQHIQAIKDYEPNINVLWVPVGERREGQAAFILRYEPPGEVPFTLFHVATEEDFDERVLMRIIQNDQRHGQTTTLSDLETFEAVKKIAQRRQFLDSMEEANDLAAFVFKSRLNTIRINKDFIIKE